jgi:hypothetical protein
MRRRRSSGDSELNISRIFAPVRAASAYRRVSRLETGALVSVLVMLRKYE